MSKAFKSCGATAFTNKINCGFYTLLYRDAIEAFTMNIIQKRRAIYHKVFPKPLDTSCTYIYISGLQWSENAHLPVTKALFRLPAQIRFLAYPDFIRIGFRKSGQLKTTWMAIFANQIQTTWRGGLKCDSNPICTDVSSVRMLCSLKSGIGASLHRYWAPEWSFLMDKTGC